MPHHPARRALIAAALAAPFAGDAHAQAPWPDRPVRFYVGFAPGTATDNLARVIAEALSPMLGQPVVIENRPGAQGTLAGAAVARAPSDGHAVMMGSGTTHGAASALLRSVPYDPVRDFMPVLRLAHITQVLVVRADHPAEDLPGLARHLRAANARVFYGSGSSGNLLPAAMMMRHLGVDSEVVTYRSPPQALADLIGGRFPLMFIDLSAAMGAIRAGQLRAIAISSERASPNLPGVPSLATLIPGFGFETWFGMYLPTGTPAPIAARLGAATREVLDRPETWARLSPMGFERSTGSAGDLAALTQAEVARWRAAVRDLGIQPE
ncbi:tripartite tricarboxylate transporter substrate binding protein [Roseomonas sp. PWR1]|uniref:Tripartite tricarboxylate transporter substrate binding protein n=1 Tax=Roseomonas nitratireducens TaxID=2820810 RepID=A0ABS4AQD2_9PROT|nr:tripartite tricarboxylate transporter substrate binding protein [Neoroseomonas nitratireducens]MBP0463477.1 tripartite tricarboxylate transporter substrate binding protein [Neoroseomonas nitratireducens]